MESKIFEEIKELNQKFNPKDAHSIIKYFLEKYKDKIVISSSLGAEDQVITDMALKIDINAHIFTLDTGRLPQETYDLITEVMKKYNIKYKIYFPDTLEVEKLESEKGPNCFYESIENRKLCCEIRKVKPLKRALKGKQAWITGLRREQSTTRKEINIIEWDDANNMLKINPIAFWTWEDVWCYIRENNVPYNKLHDKNYPSIGCLPCTRAIKEGEDFRAGRWWWEQESHKECGLHYKNGKVVREKEKEK